MEYRYEDGTEITYCNGWIIRINPTEKALIHDITQSNKKTK